MKAKEIRTAMLHRPQVVAVLVTILIAAAWPAFAARKVVERIVARVNNEIITQRHYEREVGKVREQLARQYSGAELEAKVREMTKDMLRDMIDQALMVQKAKDLDINVETALVKELDAIRKEYNLSSLEDLQREVEKQGGSWEDFQDSVRRNLLMREVIGREVGRTIIVSREDARKYFLEHQKEFESPGGVNLAELLVSTEKRKPDEAEKRAKQALAELNGGTRWNVVVEKYSDGSTAKEGGGIGIMKQGTLAPAIERALSKIEVNGFTDLIETKYGYLILKLLDRRSPGIPAFEEVETRVSEMMYNQKMQPALRQFLATLRKESYILIAPGYVDTGAERPSDTMFAKKGQ